MFGPTGWRVSDLFISDIDVCSVLDQELDHLLMAVQSGVVQTCSRVIKSAGNDVDFRA